MIESNIYEVFRKALERKSSFNVIHFATMMKVDIFILKNRAFDREAFRRKKLDTLEINESSIRYYFSSPEDIILSKLEWYQMGGQVSERQWNDIITLNQLFAGYCSFSLVTLTFLDI